MRARNDEGFTDIPDLNLDPEAENVVTPGRKGAAGRRKGPKFGARLSDMRSSSSAKQPRPNYTEGRVGSVHAKEQLRAAQRQGRGRGRGGGRRGRASRHPHQVYGKRTVTMPADEEDNAVDDDEEEEDEAELAAEEENAGDEKSKRLLTFSANPKQQKAKTRSTSRPDADWNPKRRLDPPFGPASGRGATQRPREEPAMHQALAACTNQLMTNKTLLVRKRKHPDGDIRPERRLRLPVPGGPVQPQLRRAAAQASAPTSVPSSNRRRGRRTRQPTLPKKKNNEVVEVSSDEEEEQDDDIEEFDDEEEQEDSGVGTGSAEFWQSVAPRGGAKVGDFRQRGSRDTAAKSLLSAHSSSSRTTSLACRSAWAAFLGPARQENATCCSRDSPPELQQQSPDEIRRRLVYDSPRPVRIMWGLCFTDRGPTLLPLCGGDALSTLSNKRTGLTLVLPTRITVPVPRECIEQVTVVDALPDALQQQEEAPVEGCMVVFSLSPVSAKPTEPDAHHGWWELLHGGFAPASSSSSSTSSTFSSSTVFASASSSSNVVASSSFPGDGSMTTGGARPHEQMLLFAADFVLPDETERSVELQKLLTWLNGLQDGSQNGQTVAGQRLETLSSLGEPLCNCITELILQLRAGRNITLAALEQHTKQHGQLAMYGTHASSMKSDDEDAWEVRPRTRRGRRTSARLRNRAIEVEEDDSDEEKALLFKYPLPQVEEDEDDGPIFRVTIRGDDLRSTRTEQLLNDNLIDFQISFWLDKDNIRAQAHAFSTHFFTKLSEPDDNLQVNSALERYNEGFRNVMRWTRKIDIFGLSMLFMPIHAAVHWSLFLVVNPDKLLSVCTDAPGTSASSEPGKKVAEVRTATSAESDDSGKGNRRRSRRQRRRSWRGKAAIYDSEFDSDVDTRDEGDDAGAGRQAKSRIPTAATAADAVAAGEHVPFLLHLDSLNSESWHKTRYVAGWLFNWLAREAMHRKPDALARAMKHAIPDGDPTDVAQVTRFVRTCVPVKRMPVPHQENGHDCGVYVLRFVQAALQPTVARSRPEIMERVHKNSEPDDITALRRSLRKELKGLTQRFRDIERQQVAFQKRRKQQAAVRRQADAGGAAGASSSSFSTSSLSASAPTEATTAPAEAASVLVTSDTVAAVAKAAAAAEAMADATGNENDHTASTAAAASAAAAMATCSFAQTPSAHQTPQPQLPERGVSTSSHSGSAHTETVGAPSGSTHAAGSIDSDSSAETSSTSTTATASIRARSRVEAQAARSKMWNSSSPVPTSDDEADDDDNNENGVVADDDDLNGHPVAMDTEERSSLSRATSFIKEKSLQIASSVARRVESAMENVMAVKE